MLSRTEPAPPGAEAAAADSQRQGPVKLARHVLQEVAVVLAVNTAIACALYLVNHRSLVDNLIYSHSIGLSIHSCATLLSLAFGARRADPRALVIAVPLGSIGGTLLGSTITGDGLLRTAQSHADALVAMFALALLLGTLASYFFYARGLLAERKALLQQAELARVLDCQRLGEAQLRALQAQIEPHFLFNTLSNVVSLIDGEPAVAKGMLVDLTRLLRSSLARARADSLPLADELADIRAYLDIQRQRMGTRLRYAIEIEPGLGSVAVAPYLVQPLVENAIRHGLEPQVGGGRLTVRVARDHGELVIEVADTGRGLQPEQTPGVALANIRARLAAMHGDGAALSLHPNLPQGLVARLRLPLAA